MTLEIIKAVDTAFGQRALRHHAAGASVQELPFEQHQHRGIARLILDPRLSRKILTSKSFPGANYFHHGLQQHKAAGRDVDLVAQFFDQALLFREGSEHRALKSRFAQLLDEATNQLDAMRPQLLRYFSKRSHRHASPLDFAQCFVRLTLGSMAARAAHRPLRTVWRAMAMRRNVFHAFFHPLCHLAANQALRKLYGETIPPATDSPDWPSHLLAQSVLLMGVDPVIGSICANLLEGRIEPMASSVHRHAATSYVLRLCAEAVTVDGIDFQPGDACYLALLPSAESADTASDLPEDKPQNGSLAFGIGVHTCIGKHITLKLMAMADEVVDHCFSEGFVDTCVLAPDGAFLAFRPATGKSPV